MAITRMKQRDLALQTWIWSSEDDGSWSHDTLRTAAACEIAQQSILQTARLDTLISLLNSLGADGLHGVIKHHYAKTVEAQERSLRRKRQKARERKQSKASA